MIQWLILISLSISAMTMTISKTKAFARLRESLEFSYNRARESWLYDDGAAWIVPCLSFLAGVIKCPYCLSHWFAIAAVILWGVNLFGGFWGWILTPFVIVALASAWSIVIDYFFTRLERT